MTFRWTFSLVSLLCMCTQANAITVRSGEHGAFTRLVFSIGSNPWSIKSVDNVPGILVDVENADSDFNLSEVFDRIDRARVANTLPTDEGLRIEFGCDCTYEAFDVAGGFLVVDVREKTEEERLSQISETEPELPVTEKPLPMELNLDQQRLRDSLTSARLGASPRIGPEETPAVSLPLPFSTNIATEIESSEVDRAEVTQKGSEILNSIAAAASSGSLNASLDHSFTPSSQETEVISPEMESAAPENSVAEQLTDALVSNERTSGRISLGGEFCTSAEFFSFVESEQKSPSADPSLLFGEFDRIDTSAAKDFGMMLLSKGFGAEARNIFSMIEGVEPAILALTYAVDGEVDPSGTFAGQTECAGPVAFWALVASDLSASQFVDGNSVLQELETLPRSMSGHLGPLVAQRLIEAGQNELAMDVVRRLERMNGAVTPAIELLRAESQLAQGRVQEATPTLNSLANLPGPEAQRAVVASVEAARSSDSDVPRSVAELTEAFAKEMGDHANGSSLWRAHVIALLQQNNLEGALTAFKDRAGVDPKTVETTANDLASDLVAKSSDFQFIQVALATEIPREPLKRTRLGEKYIERLSALGLLDLSISELAQLGLEGKSESLIISQAKALAGLGQYREASLALKGLDSATALELRAKVLMKLEDYATAATLFETLEDEASAVEATWLSENWSELTGSQTARSLAAETFSTDQIAENLNEPSLDVSRSLAESSSDTRTAVAALLGELTITE